MSWFRRKTLPPAQDPFLHVSGTALDLQLRSAIRKVMETPDEHSAERERALSELRVIQAEQRRRLVRPVHDRFRRMKRLLG